MFEPLSHQATVGLQDVLQQDRKTKLQLQMLHSYSYKCAKRKDLLKALTLGKCGLCEYIAEAGTLKVYCEFLVLTLSCELQALL